MDFLINSWNKIFDFSWDFFGEYWWEIFICIAIYIIYKKIFRKKSDPTMFKKKYKTNPHRSLRSTKKRM